MKNNIVSKEKNKKIITYIVVLLTIVFGIAFFTTFLSKISFGEYNPKIELETDVQKYVNFKISEDNKGSLLQYDIKTNLEYQENDQYVPVKESQIKLELNQIKDKYPHSVKVIAKSTEATNGKKGNIKENYAYDSQTGILTILTSNQNENGELINTENTGKQSKDNYIIMAYYDTYSDNEEERQIGFKSEVIVVLNEDDKLISHQDEFKDTVKENIGELTSVEYNNLEIYNGNIKSNIINGTEYSTQYTEIQNIVVSKKEAQDSIELLEENTFANVSINKNGEKVLTDLGNNNQLIYKSTKIKKDNLVKLLGEEGKLYILDDKQNIITTIDENTEFEEDGTVIINYENDLTNILIRTSKIQNEGILEIENTKEIKSTMINALDTKIKTTAKIIGTNETIVKNEETEEETTIKNIVFENQKENMININNAKTNVDWKLSKTEWTNKEQNEITFDINLNANSFKDNMFKNPTLEIELPAEVEKVILGDSFIVYGNGLELQNVRVETEETGIFKIVANVIGTQTNYNDNSLGLGTNIQIPATVILRKDIESSNSNINLTFTNEFSLYNELEVSNVSKELILTNYQEENIENVEQNQTNLYTRIENSLRATLNDEAQEGLKTEVVAVKGSTQLKNGDTVYEGEYIKYNINITNTSDEVIDNVKVIGSIPEGTVYAEVDADYHNYMGKLNQEIYGDEYDRPYDYKFDNTVSEKEINIGKLKPGEKYSTFYEVYIEDLNEGEENKEILTTIKTYAGNKEYNIFEQNNIIENGNMKVFLGAFLDNGEDRWNYSLKVDSEEDKEVQVKIVFPKLYDLQLKVQAGAQGGVPSRPVADNDNILIDTIRTNTEYWYEGEIKSENVRKSFNDSPVIFTSSAVIEENGKTYNSNENRIEYEFKSISITMTSENEGEEVKYEDEINYEIVIKNTGKTNLNQSEMESIAIDLEDYLPEEVDPVSMEYEYWDLTEDEEFVKNTGTKELNKAKDKDGNKMAEVDLTTNIPYGETISVRIKTTARDVSEKTKIENSATVKAEIGRTEEGEEETVLKTSNIVTHTILPDTEDTEDIEEDDPRGDEEDNDNQDNQNSENQDDKGNNPDIKSEKYSISGNAWIDSNKDGQRQESEKKLEGLQITVIDSENSNIISDNITTNSNGEYKVNDLSEGKYIVLFKYDTNNYRVTEYKKSGISSSSNSDANTKEINLKGEQITVGATDVIDLNASVSNIDIGLIKNGICDIKLDKYISKVSVNTSSNTKQYSYDNQKLAKVEIKSKEINGATVVVEYKIDITNEGEIPTKIGKVIDYLPDGFIFSSELNSSWGTQSSGELVNTSLANRTINQGETISLPLVLTKKMNSNSTGEFVNAAEIGEISNSLDIKDQDSTPGNKMKGEDDYSEATLILSISTGGIIYIGIAIIIVITLMIIFTILSKKGLLKAKRINNISKFTIFMLVLAGVLFSKDMVWADRTVIENRKQVYFTYEAGNTTYRNKYGSTYFSAKVDGEDFGALCQNAGVAAATGKYKFKKATSLETADSDTSASPTIDIKKIDYEDRY